MRLLFAMLYSIALVPLAAAAEICPEKNIVYWQAFTPGGESDLSARHQRVVLKKKCPAIETIIQYKPGAGGGLMWAQMNNLPGDGFNVVGINLPHIVFQPLEGEVQYKTPDVTPVFWFQCALRRASGQPCVNCITSWVASRQAWRRRIGVACGCASRRT
jgi:tripartite-type tricarboxylate transporter receptor subunit TctC